jgi:hypothetical protein
VGVKRSFPKLRHHVEALGNGFYRVESASAPGEHYDVDIMLGPARGADMRL